MKNTIAKTITLLAAAFALNANAHGRLPIAIDPVDPAHATVIQLRMGGGMPVPGGLRSRTITVTRTGLVNVAESRFGKTADGMFDQVEEREYLLATMEAEDMLRIGEAVEQLKGGPLVKPSSPGCMDAPGYTYSVVKGFKAVTVYQIFNCQQQPLKDKAQRPAAATIRSYLDQLNGMVH